MSGTSDDTPLMADTDHMHSHDEINGQRLKALPANAYFKFTLKAFTIIISLLSLVIFSLLMVTHAWISVGPFDSTQSTQDAIVDLVICIIVNFFVTAPNVYIQFPILVNIAAHIAMMIVIFVFSSKIIGDGWPGYNFCYSGTEECIQARTPVRIAIGIIAGVSIFIGLLYISAILLRLTALSRSPVWRRKWALSRKFREWNPTGFTVHFTFSVAPYERPGPAIKLTSTAEEDRLIET
ncbi:hypothetical protein OIDMADRAFT_148742 [Oidiodendron maius Zn]|uniref:MARVEL domain-containing protein n=1 Tax=Oidiodendron maius (strain Zn) TaxID=913774 RepID=A0A0C3D1A1_OIDMZ|nr:hypothetical protein OIDMADRAFT_148742 [Oidiodendron maius Zn]